MESDRGGDGAPQGAVPHPGNGKGKGKGYGAQAAAGPEVWAGRRKQRQGPAAAAPRP